MFQVSATHLEATPNPHVFLFILLASMLYTEQLRHRKNFTSGGASSGELECGEGEKVVFAISPGHCIPLNRSELREVWSKGLDCGKLPHAHLGCALVLKKYY